MNKPTKKKSPTAIVPEKAMNIIRLGWAQDRIEAANEYGGVDCSWDATLMTSDHITAEQQGWDEDDEAKQTDFSTSPYWLHFSGGESGPIPVENAKELAGMHEDLGVYDEEMSYAQLNSELCSGWWGPTHVRALIKAGADVNAFNEDGYSPLHSADVLDDPAIVQLLIDHGADVNARTSHGSTPLHHVRHSTSAEVLIRNGADVTARDNDGETALDWARRRIDSDPLCKMPSHRETAEATHRVIAAATSKVELERQLARELSPWQSPAQAAQGATEASHQEPQAQRKPRRM